MFQEISPAMWERMRYLESLDGEQRQQGLPTARRLCQVPPETGRFLALLAASAPAGACVEVGTSAGYSTLWLTLARRGRGPRIQTFEASEWKVALARETFALSGVAAEIDLVVGDAREGLGQCRDVAFCFLDAAKPQYLDYYERLAPQLLPGAILAADNIESHREELAPFVARVLQDPRMDALVVPIGKGVLIGRRTTAGAGAPP